MVVQKDIELQKNFADLKKLDLELRGLLLQLPDSAVKEYLLTKTLTFYKLTNITGLDDIQKKAATITNKVILGKDEIGKEHTKKILRVLKSINLKIKNIINYIKTY